MSIAVLDNHSNFNATQSPWFLQHTLLDGNLYQNTKRKLRLPNRPYGVTFERDPTVAKPRTAAGYALLPETVIGCLFDYLDIHDIAVPALLLPNARDVRLVILFRQPVRLIVPERYLGYVVVVRRYSDFINHKLREPIKLVE